MTKVRLLVPFATAIGLAACSGGSGTTTPYTGGTSNSASSASSASSTLQRLSSIGSSIPDVKTISVKPDKVDLTIANPSQTVTLSAPKGTTFTEKDDCASKGIATLANSGTDTYLVTAGLTAGKCTAKFLGKDSNGKKAGSASLKVDNTV